MDKSFDRIFSEDEKNLYNMSDGKFRTEDGYEFNIHRVVIAGSSSYFYDLYFGNKTRANSDILIPDIKGEVLDKILCYIYTGKFICTEGILSDLLNFSHRFLLSNLHLQVKRRMKNNISVRNCLQILLESRRINQEDIFKTCFRFLEIQFENVASDCSSNIEIIPAEILKELLSSGSLCSRSEDIVWDVIVKWTEYDKAERQHFIPELLTCLKVPCMDSDLAFTILKHDIVSRNPFCKKMYKPNSSIFPENSLQIFCNFLQMHHNTLLRFDSQRYPKQIYIFVRNITRQGSRNWSQDIYFSYDRQLDIFRYYKRVVHDMPFKIILIGKCMCLIRNHSRGGYFHFFNIYDTSAIQPQNAEVQRHFFSFLKHNGRLYILGGCSVDTFESTGMVQAYDPELNRWIDLASMIPVEHILSITLGEKIYVLGDELGHSPSFRENVIVQEYDPESNSWTTILSPQRRRTSCAFLAFRGKLYLIGGSTKSVEVFDFVSNCWNDATDLPFAYTFPMAKVFQDELIVYERYWESHHWSTRIVQWCNESERWKPVEDQKLLYNLYTYGFDVVEDFDTIKAITDDNRNDITSFENCPFVGNALLL